MGLEAQRTRHRLRIWYITTNNLSTSYNTSSDRRLKTNISPSTADKASSIIDSIEIVQYDWITGGHTDFGIIAQNVVNLIPHAIKIGDDGDEVTDPWGVDYSKIVPILIKEIQNLRYRISQLENI